MAGVIVSYPPRKLTLQPLLHHAMVVLAREKHPLRPGIAITNSVVAAGSDRPEARLLGQLVDYDVRNTVLPQLAVTLDTLVLVAHRNHHQIWL